MTSWTHQRIENAEQTLLQNREGGKPVNIYFLG